MWVMIYPFFHSLQYLMFVYSYKRGETRIHLSEAQTTEQQQQIKNQLIRFAVLAVGMGALFFEIVPGTMESWLNPERSMLLPLTAIFTIFINIQHYFIDNIIWRKEHAEIAQYVFYRDKQRLPA
jgi:hypothetical protein